jgi:anti-anti-sigma regulatory factor
MREGMEATFAIEGGVLVCPTDMNRVAPGDFNEWCGKLLRCDEPTLVVDFSETRFILSPHIGIVAQAWSDAVAAGRKLVVKASGEVKQVMDATGLSTVLEVIEP